jgi:hypothetical protein
LACSPLIRTCPARQASAAWVRVLAILTE